MPAQLEDAARQVAAGVDNPTGITPTAVGYRLSGTIHDARYRITVSAADAGEPPLPAGQQPGEPWDWPDDEEHELGGPAFCAWKRAEGSLDDTEYGWGANGTHYVLGFYEGLPVRLAFWPTGEAVPARPATWGEPDVRRHAARALGAIVTEALAQVPRHAIAAVGEHPGGDALTAAVCVAVNARLAELGREAQGI